MIGKPSGSWLSQRNAKPLCTMTDPAPRIRAAYDEWATLYDTNDNPTRDLSARVLREQSFALKGAAVLEIGCGTGLNTTWLAERAAHVTAVDFSEGMLRKASQRVGSANVTFQVHDITKPWPFKEEAYDLAVASLVLEHVEALGPIFQEAHCVLKPKGLFYISELHPYRQLQGSQAKYERPDTREEVRVLAFQHPVSAFVNSGLDAGFALERLNEWQTEEDPIPRLLTLLFRRG